MFETVCENSTHSLSGHKHRRGIHKGRPLELASSRHKQKQLAKRNICKSTSISIKMAQLFSIGQADFSSLKSVGQSC